MTRHPRVAVFGIVLIVLVITTAWWLTRSPTPVFDGGEDLRDYLERLYEKGRYEDHTYIQINGDDSFTKTNGVRYGSGTKEDPFIIENWEIKGGPKDCIRIENTSSYFVVRNCYLESNLRKNGVSLLNAHNGLIENNIITDNEIGILLDYEGNQNNTIQKNWVAFNEQSGICFEHIGGGHHSYNEIAYNTIGFNGKGIYMVMSHQNKVYRNNIVGNKGYGIEIMMCIGGGRRAVHHSGL